MVLRKLEYDNLTNLTAGDSEFSISFASSTIANFILFV